MRMGGRGVGEEKRGGRGVGEEKRGRKEKKKENEKRGVANVNSKV